MLGLYRRLFRVIWQKVTVAYGEVYDLVICFTHWSFFHYGSLQNACQVQTDNQLKLFVLLFTKYIQN